MGWNPVNWRGQRDEACFRSCADTQQGAGHAHGGDHTYLSPNSDMLGIVLERISGERFPDLCSRLLWQPLGATADAFITVDPEGAPRTAGGVSCRPHDLLALGQMLVNGGNANGSRIVSERWIADMQANGDSAAWARGTQADFLKTWPLPQQLVPGRRRIERVSRRGHPWPVSLLRPGHRHGDRLHLVPARTAD
jgi:CubicO group peptidase (beta-lactamase class C family)